MAADLEVAGRGVWPRVYGPLVTLLVCTALWALAYFNVVPLAPTPFLCLAVAFAAQRGRITGGLISVALALIYVAGVAPVLGPLASLPSVTDVVVLAIILVALVFLISSRVDWLEARVDAALAAASTAERRAALVTGDVARRANEQGEVGKLYEDLKESAGRDARSLEMLEAALDAVAQGVAVVDQQANLVWWNRSLASMSGIPLDRRGDRSGIIGASPFLDRGDLTRALEHGETVTRLGTATNGTNGTHGREKSHTYIEQYSPVETSSGQRLVAVTVAQVIPNGTANAPPPSPEPAPAPVERQVPDPMVLDPAVIDTLRAPLAAIREYVWFMVAGPDEPRRRANDEYGSRVLGAAQQMDDRIQALAEYSHVLRGAVKMDNVQLDEVVRDALQGLEPGLTTSGARVRIVSQPAPGPVLGDRQLLTLAVTHLIGNAIKYVPADVPPRVLIWLEQVDGRARLAIEDNGIGIAAGDERRLFRLFERLPEAEPYPGNGVGLAVVRAVVERLGGRLGVQSEPGWGSRFWVELRESVPDEHGGVMAAPDTQEEPAPITRPEGASFAAIGEEEWRPI